MRSPDSRNDRDLARDTASSRSGRDEETPPLVGLFALLSTTSFLAYLGASRAVRGFLELALTLWRRLLEIAA